MFNFNKKSSVDKIASSFKIVGMHCVSCAMNIDGALEDLEGVSTAKTNYAKAETVVEYDEKITNEAEIIKTISEIGYTVQ
jgi:copper chaperone CopZ